MEPDRLNLLFDKYHALLSVAEDNLNKAKEGELKAIFSAEVKLLKELVWDLKLSM